MRKLIVRGLVVWITAAFTVSALAAVPTVTTFPTFGLAVTPPSDATFELTEIPSHIGLYRFAPSSPHKGIALLLEIAPAKGKSAADFAAHFISSAGATTRQGVPFIGGEQAVEVSAEFNRESYRQRLTYFAVHGSYLYMFSALAEPDINGSGALDEFVSSAMFIPIDSPLKHIQNLSEKPFYLMPGVGIRGPACMRVHDQKAGHIEVEIQDFVLDDPAMMVEADHIKIAVPQPFSDLQKKYSAALESQFAFPEPMQWHTQAALPNLHISQPVPLLIAPPGQAPLKMVERYCMLDLGNGDFLQILFSIPNKNAQDVKEYIALSDRMLESITCGPAATLLSR
jgi:hypothetical protein